MTRHIRLDDDARDRAALFALGSLLPAEAARMETHLEGCATCRAEVDSLRPVVGDLALAAPQAEPPAALRERILGRIRAKEREAAPQPWKGWSPDPRTSAFTYSLAAEGVWETTVFPGIETRCLFVDKANDRITMLIRMAPGSTYPSHVHGGPEDCLVLEGDLRSGDVGMRAGDYKRAAEGSVDPVQSTEEGCLLLVTSSGHDELLP